MVQNKRFNQCQDLADDSLTSQVSEVGRQGTTLSKTKQTDDLKS